MKPAEWAHKLFVERQVKKGVEVLKKAPLETQIESLKLAPHSQLRTVIEQNAPTEMHKGAMKLAKEGKPVTVDNLLGGDDKDRYRNQPGFQKVAADASLDEAWWIALAEEECRKWETQKMVGNR